MLRFKKLTCIEVLYMQSIPKIFYKKQLWLLLLFLISMAEYIWTLYINLYGPGINIAWGMVNLELLICLIFKDDITQFKIKKTLQIPINLLFILIFSIIIFINYNRQQAECKITTIQQNEYRINLMQTYHVNYTQLKTVLKGQVSHDYYIFIGCSTNPYCRKLSPVVKRLSLQQTVYYFNTDKYSLNSELKRISRDKNQSKKDCYLIKIHHDISKNKHEINAVFTK